MEKTAKDGEVAAAAARLLKDARGLLTAWVALVRANQLGGGS